MSFPSVPASESSSRIVNPIRRIVDELVVPKDNTKSLINMSLGDPTRYGNLETAPIVREAVAEALSSGSNNGYTHSEGMPTARAAIAQMFSEPGSVLTADDVIITSGCSSALQMSIEALCNQGDAVLLPKPGFPLYQTIADNLGVRTIYYPLDPANGWKIDISQLKALVAKAAADGVAIRALLINNPSNPCGSIFDEAHLKEILSVAEEHHIPIISDEVYRHMAFDGTPNPSIAALSTVVPALVVGGTAKRYLAPGWRVGWIMVYNRGGAFDAVRKGLRNLSQIILGANTLVQGAVPRILAETPSSFYTQVMAQLQRNAATLERCLADCRFVRVVQPQGAMYVMMEIHTDMLDDSISCDRDFARVLLQEEMVFVLPGVVFGAPNFVRLVTCPPAEQLEEASARIVAFCERHQQK